MLDLPYIMPAQAQKHVTHNEALRRLDALIQIGVDALALDTPPETPAEGQRVVVGPEPSGAFAGHAGALAAFQDGAWAFFTPAAGWIAWDAGEGALKVFDGEAWLPAIPEAQTLSSLGINAAADETNRLAVSAPASLFSHEGAGHQLKVNKAHASDTGSLLFQTGWSGRAEMGLAGNDDFSIKVSADGEDWHDALVIDRNTGRVGVGTESPQTQLHVGTGAPEHAATTFYVRSPVTNISALFSDGTRALALWGHHGGVPSIGSYSNHDFALIANNSKRVYLKTNGSVGIGASNPHGSAQLQIDSTTRGFLPPRLTEAQRDAIASPAEGLMIYNLTDHEPQFWDGVAWVGMAA
jgi:hypothetical protein